MDRRTFIKLGTFGTAAALTGTARAADAPPAITPVFRTLGRTGMKITIVGVGAMRTSEAAVFRAAFDMGANYVDTARVYADGKNERIVGEALKGLRDKVYVATKVKGGTKEAMEKSIAASLEALKLDYVDLLQLHDISTKEGVMNPVYREVLTEAKKAGKTRFIGITCHQKEADTLTAIADDPDKFFDTVLVTYNFKSMPGVKPAIERLAKANVGVIAMKTQAGGYKTKELGDVSPHQASLKFVLQDTNVTAAIPAMVNLQQVKEDLAVMGMKIAQADLDILRRYDAAISDVYCHRCGACAQSCGAKVDIPTVNRSLMYAEGYGDLALARATYAGLAPETMAAACADCAICTAKCAHGLDIAARMRQARELFA